MFDTEGNTLKVGRIHKNQKYADEDFMVTYGDGVSDINITELVNFHKGHGESGTT